MILSRKVLLVAALAASCATLSSATADDEMHNLLRGADNDRKLADDSPFFYPETGTMEAPLGTVPETRTEEGGEDEVDVGEGEGVNPKTKQDKQKEEQVAREFAPPSTSYNELLGQIGSGNAMPEDSSQSNIESRGNGEGGEEVDIGDAEPNCDIDPKLPSKSFVMSVLGGGDQCKGSCECASGCCVKYWSHICIDPLAGGGYWGDRCIA